MRHELRIEDVPVGSMFRTKPESFAVGMALFLAALGITRGLRGIVHLPFDPIVPVMFAWLIGVVGVTFKRTRRASVVASRDGIQIGTVHLPRETIRNVYRLSDPTRIVIERTTFKGRWEITLLDADADRLLRAVDLDPAHRVTSVPIGSYLLGRAQPILFLLATAGMWAMSQKAKIFFPVGLCSMALFVLVSIPARADVGADGVLLRWLGFRRFLSARDIVEAVPVTSRLFAGVRIRTRSGNVFLSVREAKAPGIAALLPRGAAAASGLEETLLARSHEAASLERLVTDASFRAATVGPERLWELIENPAAQPAARAAAVHALAPSLDADGRRRLRAVEEATACPDVRAALASTAS